MKMMKRMSALALALALSLSLTACGGMSAGSRTDGIFYDATGVSPDAVLLRVGGKDVTAENYFYQLYNMAGNLANYCGEDGFDLDTGDGTTTTFGQLAVDYTMESVKEFAVVENWAKEHGLVLNEAQLADITAEIDAYEAEYGEFGFRFMGVTRETMTEMYESFAKYDLLEQSVYVEGGALAPTEEDMTAFRGEAGKADHILLSTVDEETQEPLPEAEIQAQRARAEELLAQLRAAEGVEALFDELANEHSEDPGRAYYPDGYIYGPGGMSLVEEFLTAAKALDEGEVSDIVETNYGYHILLKRAIDDETLIAEGGYFIWKLKADTEGIAIEYSDLYREKVENMDMNAFFVAVTDARDAMYEEYLNAQSDAAEEGAEGESGEEAVG